MPYSVSPVIFDTITGRTTTVGVNSPDLGTRVQSGGNEYVYVYNGGANSITAGYAAGPMTGTTGYTVSASSVTQIDYAIGLATATFATATYGFILTRGFATFCAATMNIADLLMVGADGAIATAIAGQLAPVIGKVRITTTGGSGYGYFSF